MRVVGDKIGLPHWYAFFTKRTSSKHRKSGVIRSQHAESRRLEFRCYKWISRFKSCRGTKSSQHGVAWGRGLWLDQGERIWLILATKKKKCYRQQNLMIVVCLMRETPLIRVFVCVWWSKILSEDPLEDDLMQRHCVIRASDVHVASYVVAQNKFDV